MKSTLLRISLTIAFVFSGASVASADKYDDQVKAKLALIAVHAQDEGYDVASEIKLDELRHSQSDSFTVTMNEGYEYLISAACDNDCEDIDLVLFDENDNEISRDNDSDPAPLVRAVPRWSGEFTLRVKMYECNNNPCRYGIMLLSK